MQSATNPSLGKRKKELCLPPNHKEKESLRNFVELFNPKILEVGDCNNKVAIIAFTNGLWDQDLVYINFSSEFVMVMVRVKNHMLTNEALHLLTNEICQQAGNHKKNDLKDRFSRPKTHLPSSRHLMPLNLPKAYLTSSTANELLPDR